MCESSVYVLKGSEKSLVMAEAARVLVSGDEVTCVGIAGDRKTVKGVELAEANLMRHEIILKPRKG